MAQKESQQQNLRQAVATLEPSLAFGIRSGVANPLQFASDRSLFYPCGNYLVLQSTEPHQQGELQQQQQQQQQQQRFLSLGRQSQSGVSALAVSPDRRFAAVAESPATASDRAVVSIVDLHSGKVKRQVTSPDVIIAGVDIACLAFSPDSKFLAGLLREPACQLAYWQWTNNKLLASYSPSSSSVTFSQVSFSPSDPSLISLTGRGGGLRVLRYAEGQLKPAAAGVPAVRLEAAAGAVSRHCWLADSGLALGTEAGRLIVVEGSERRMDIDLNSGGGSAGGVRCLQPCSRGFAVALEGASRVSLFDRVDGGGPEVFVRSREIAIPDDAISDDPDASPVAIVDMCVSPGEETLAVISSRRQVWTFNLMSPPPDSTEIQAFEPLTEPCHIGPAVGLDVCLQKPLFATCSTDCSVRIWNYETGKCILSKQFPDEAYSIAMHPSGHQIAVGFVDKLRLMNVLADGGLRTVKEFQIRGCRECAFSHGGHLLAAAQGNTIQVFHTLRYNCVYVLKGHSGRVRCLAWRPDDFGLVSGGQEGAVYEWDLRSGARAWEHVHKACAYTGLALDADFGGVFAAGTDAALREIAKGGDVQREAEAATLAFTSLAVSANGKALYAATTAGSVRSLMLPIGSPADQPWLEWPGHSAPASRLRLTPWEDSLVTAGDDACVIVWRPASQQPLLRSRRDRPNWSEEALVPQADLAELRLHTEELKARAEELRISAAHEMHVQRAAYETERHRLEAEIDRCTGTASVRQIALRAERDRIETELTAQLAEVRQAAERSLEEAADASEARLLREYEKLQAALARSQRMQEDYNHRLSESAKDAQLAQDRMAANYEAQLAELRDRLQLTDHRRTEESVKAADALQLTEEDADAELLATKTAYERRLRLVKDLAAKTKNDLDEARSRLGFADRRSEQHAEEAAALRVDLEKSRATAAGLRTEQARLRGELAKSAEETAELLQRAEQTAKEIRHLESGNFVLEYELGQVRSQLKPRDEDVQNLRTKVDKMTKELIQYDGEKAQLHLAIENLSDRVRAAEKAAESEAKRRRLAEAALARLIADLHACAGFTHEPKRLRDCVVAMHRRHVRNLSVTPETRIADEVSSEIAAQRSHQEATVATLKRKLKEQSGLLKGQYVRIMQENTGLLQQVRELTQELSKSRAETRSLQVAVGLQRKDNGEAKQLVAMVKLARRDPLEDLRGEEFKRTVESQRAVIKQLRQQVRDMQDPETAGTSGEFSLPPIEAQ